MAAIAPVMTSGNGNANNNSNNSSSGGQHNGESKVAQAIVKSHILTHLIEGFVIQEGAEPFPVSRCVSWLRPKQTGRTSPKKVPNSKHLNWLLFTVAAVLHVYRHSVVSCCIFSASRDICVLNCV